MLKATWGLVYAAHKVASVQANLDESIKLLITNMKTSCEAARDAVSTGSHRYTVKRILQQVIQCSYFIKAFYESPTFGSQIPTFVEVSILILTLVVHRFLENTTSSLAQSYADALSDMKTQLRSPTDDIMNLRTNDLAELKEARSENSKL